MPITENTIYAQIDFFLSGSRNKQQKEENTNNNAPISAVIRRIALIGVLLSAKERLPITKLMIPEKKLLFQYSKLRNFANGQFVPEYQRN